MSALTRFLPNISSCLSHATRPLQTFTGNLFSSSLESSAGGLYQTTIRTIIRCHFPRPNERKRILRHGWKKRMSTPEGRRVLMNRILKGRHVYSH